MSQKKRSVRNRFIIFTNGEKTEFNYFNLIKSKRSEYKVEVKFSNSCCADLVKEAIKFKKENSRGTNDINKVYCVFDIDNSYDEGILKEAIRLAKENEICTAFSNPSFEIWLISHYKRYDKHSTSKELISEMNKIISDIFKLKREYDKSDKGLLEKYFIKKGISDAVNNSKIIYQKFLVRLNKESDELLAKDINDMNACNNVFQLISDLKLKFK